MSTRFWTILRLRSRTVVMSIWTFSLLMPNSSLRKKYEATLALWMMFLLGRHAMFGHAAPIYFRLITTVFIPFLARVQAINLPEAPLPRMSKSYSSGCDAVILEILDSMPFFGINSPGSL